VQALETKPDQDEEEATKEAVHPSFLGMFRSVSHSAPYQLLSVAAALSIAVYWTYSAIFAQILLPYGITEAQSGSLGAIKILLSVIPATLIAKYIDRTRNYKGPLIVANAVAAICYVGVTYSLEEYHHPWLFALLWHVPMGIAQSVIMPVSLEYMVEVTFPVDPAISAGVFMYALRILCTIIVSAAPLFLPAKSTRGQAASVMTGYTILAAVPVAILVFVNSPLRRYMAEHGELIDDEEVAVRHVHQTYQHASGGGAAAVGSDNGDDEGAATADGARRSGNSHHHHQDQQRASEMARLTATQP
jgi:hypothetical protein